MKIGAENRKEVYFAIVLGVLALALLGRWIFTSGTTSSTATSTPQTVTTAAVPAPATTRVKTTGGKKSEIASRTLDPTLRFDWLKISEDTKYAGTGRNIFQTQVEIPKPVASPVITPQAAQQGQPIIQPPPPINLKFYGFASKPGEPKRIFLSEGEDIFIASEGDIIDRRYKILHITPTSVEVEDVLNNNRQSIPLTLG